MITHSSILAWRVPWTEEPSGLWSMGSQRIRITLRGGSPCPVVSQGRGDGPQAANKKPLGRTEAWHLSFPTTTLKDAVWYQDPCSSELLIALLSELGYKGKRKEGGLIWVDTRQWWEGDFLPYTFWFLNTRIYYPLKNILEIWKIKLEVYIMRCL